MDLYDLIAHVRESSFQFRYLCRRVRAKTTEKCWRSAITQLLSSNYSELDLSGEGCPFIRNEQDWSRFLTSQYCRRWKLHFAKKTANVTPTMTYMGRYLKRPPISASRLRHDFQGGLVTFDYLNHRNGRTESLILSPEALIERMIEHIPDKHFKMIRYFGFLSNRRRGEMHPKVYVPWASPLKTHLKCPATPPC